MNSQIPDEPELGSPPGDPNRLPIDHVFFDGHCGLCHRTVRFLLRRDPAGELFRFAPLQGATFVAHVPAESQIDLPDSVAVLTRDGRLLLRSEGVLYLLERAGGSWAWPSRVLRLVPRPFRDLVYDGVSRVRHRLFRRPTALCPPVEPELRERFDP